MGGCTKDQINTKTTPARFLITKEVTMESPAEMKSPIKMESQVAMEDSGCVVAYILRYFGKQATGADIYHSFREKLQNGGVAPKQLVHYFVSAGYDAHLYEGTIASLKQRVSEGVPVIVLLQEALDTAKLHYAVVVGYDETYMYLMDSMNYLVNESQPYYNRKITYDEMRELWAVQFPYVINVYVTVKTRE